MKQTFYVYQYPSGDMFFSKRDNINGWKATDTTELDVQPVKKEVEKVIIPKMEPLSLASKWVNETVPIGAYDVKVSYKVKE